MLGTLTVAAVMLRRRAPYFAVGWLWYLGTLVPVIGFVQVGGQAYADRYSYFPQIGLLIAITWGAADLAGKRARAPALAFAGAAAVVLAAVTWGQIAVWNDSITLWEHARRITGENAVVLTNLAEAVLAEKQDQTSQRKAERYLREAILIVPEAFQAHQSLGGLVQTR